MKILVCIASHGRGNDPYLLQLIDEYRQMPHHVDVVVLSNLDKPVPAGVELRVGVPTSNPWSLPFAHRAVFLERRDDYDLFIYSEDDTLLTQRNLEAFLEAARHLHGDEIAGFLRSEQGPDGRYYYSTIHHHYHWDSRSVVRRGRDVYAHFTNEHGACYVLTRAQLRHCIDSGGYGTEPHEGKYDMLVSAATDPYTRCGLRKLVCISRLEDFTCKHLTNKYVGRTGLEKGLVDVQIDALRRIADGALALTPPARVETALPGSRWAKSYYEPAREDLLQLLPPHARRVLSIGCGWGRTEAALAARGVDVTAVPLDVVIGAVARSHGVHTLALDVDGAPSGLDAGVFDAVLIAGLLHLVDDPVDLLARYRVALAPGGVVIATVPNVEHVAVRVRKLLGAPEYEGLGDYRRSGLHAASGRRARQWLAKAGFALQRTEVRFTPRWGGWNRRTLGLLQGLWADEYALVARKTA